MGSVSQPIIAATDQLGVYSPLLRGLLFIELYSPSLQALQGACLRRNPLRRRVASYRRFTGESPAITASQADRQRSPAANFKTES